MPASKAVHDPLSTDHLHGDLKGRSVRGGAVALSSQGTQFVIQTVSTVTLARLLDPSDFGIVAMVAAITGLGMAFGDFGLSEATIQRKHITHEQISALFWINVAVGAGLTLLTVGLAPLLAWAYSEPRLLPVAMVSSLAFLINGFRTQSDALLKRQMRYAALALKDIVANAVSVIVAVVLAWRGGGYWALVSVPLSANSCHVLLSWLMVKWRPGRPRRSTDVRPMVAFGGRVAASYFIYNLNRSVDQALIGWYWKATPLGLYSRACNLLMLPVRLINTPIAAIAIPALSRVNSDPLRYARYYLSTARLLMWIVGPIFGFLFVAAEPVVLLMLGPKWLEAVPVFRILSVTGPAQVLLESTVWVLVSRGQSDRLLRLWLFVSPVIIGSFALGLPFGIKGVALSYSIVFLALLPPILRFTFKETQLTLESLGEVLRYPILVSVAGALCASLASHWLLPTTLLSQFVVLSAGFATGCLLATLLHPVRHEIMTFRELFAELRP